MTLAWAIALAMIAGAALSAAMSAAWLLERRTGHSGWIDTIWSFAVGGAGLFLSVAPAGAVSTPRQWVVGGLVGAWSARLGLQILRRTLRGGDDPRYRALKEAWGPDASRRLFVFLQAQAAAGFVLALSVFAAARQPDPAFRWLDALAALLLACSILGAGIADAQLERFKANAANRGLVCESGLWAWSRHPNYFFEWLGWCAYPLFAMSAEAPGWLLLALPAPLMMYWLLVHVSGIPPLEAHMLRSRADAFRDYQSRVGAFWPRLTAQRRRSVSP